MRRIALSMLAAALNVPTAVLAKDTASTPLKRGEYLVTIGGCHDCHTPLVMGSNGPEPDMKRALSGHPQDFAVKAPATVSEPWGAPLHPR